jgi:hypothetical protein
MHQTRTRCFLSAESSVTQTWVCYLSRFTQAARFQLFHIPHAWTHPAGPGMPIGHESGFKNPSEIGVRICLTRNKLGQNRLLVNPGTHQAAPSPVQVSSGGVPIVPVTTGCPRTTTSLLSSSVLPIFCFPSFTFRV